MSQETAKKGQQVESAKVESSAPSLTEPELDKVAGGGTTGAAAPKLFESLHNGTHIPKVIIE